MSGRWASRLRRARLPALLSVLVVSGAGGSQAWGQEGLSDIVIDDARVTESSGLAVSPTDGDLLYTVNDSGNDPVVYVVDRTSGEVVGTAALAGVDSDTDDLEALAVGAAGQLWVADTGDNDHERDDTALYALPAPAVGDVTVTPEAYPVTYPSGRPDVEALVVDPVSGDRWLVTKGLLSGEVLALPDQPVPDEPVTVEPVGGADVPGLVTDGTVLPGGAAAVLRTYSKAYVYGLPDWQSLGSFRLPRQEQGESIAALSGGQTLLAGSEGSPALIDAVPLPADVVADLTGGAQTGAPPTTGTSNRSAPGAEPGADPAPGDEGLRIGLAAGLVAGGVLLLAVALSFVRRARR